MCPAGGPMFPGGSPRLHGGSPRLHGGSPRLPGGGPVHPRGSRDSCPISKDLLRSKDSRRFWIACTLFASILCCCSSDSVPVLPGAAGCGCASLGRESAPATGCGGCASCAAARVFPSSSCCGSDPPGVRLQRNGEQQGRKPHLWQKEVSFERGRLASCCSPLVSEANARGRVMPPMPARRVGTTAGAAARASCDKKKIRECSVLLGAVHCSV